MELEQELETYQNIIKEMDKLSTSKRSNYFLNYHQELHQRILETKELITMKNTFSDDRN